jgi:hypothetical protein
MAERQPLPEYSISIRHEGKHEVIALYRDMAKPGRVPRGYRLAHFRPCH